MQPQPDDSYWKPPATFTRRTWFFHIPYVFAWLLLGGGFAMGLIDAIVVFIVMFFLSGAQCLAYGFAAAKMGYPKHAITQFLLGGVIVLIFSLIYKAIPPLVS
jgi:hypothetical protein